MKSLICGTALLLAIGVGGALAQTDQPAAAGSKMTMDKKAVSKACSDQANAKGLHGQARKKFRSECKKAGGKAPE
jgi:hypothetical protein